MSLIRATFPTHLEFLNLITLISDEENKLWSSSQCIFLDFPVTAFHLGPHIFVTTLFSNISTYVLPSTWKAKYHTHMHFDLCVFKEEARDRIFCPFPKFKLLFISSWMQFLFFTFFSRYLKVITFSNYLLGIFRVVLFCALATRYNTWFSLRSLLRRLL
jgi:hypothetical protein